MSSIKSPYRRRAFRSSKPGKNARNAVHHVIGFAAAAAPCAASKSRLASRSGPSWSSYQVHRCSETMGEHHHDEQEQHDHRADTDRDQDHGEELGAREHDQYLEFFASAFGAGLSSTQTLRFLHKTRTPQKPSIEKLPAYCCTRAAAARERTSRLRETAENAGHAIQRRRWKGCNMSNRGLMLPLALLAAGVPRLGLTCWHTTPLAFSVNRSHHGLLRVSSSFGRRVRYRDLHEVRHKIVRQFSPSQQPPSPFFPEIAGRGAIDSSLF
jgi:hypothetical protein